MIDESDRNSVLETDASCLELAARNSGVEADRANGGWLETRLRTLTSRGMLKTRQEGMMGGVAFVITDAGRACLAGLRRRFGQDYGRLDLQGAIVHEDRDVHRTRMIMLGRGIMARRRSIEG